MIREDSAKIIEEKQIKYNSDLEKLKGREGIITALRAVTFILGFCLIIVGIADKSYLWIPGVLFLIGFVVLVGKHNNLDVMVARLTAKRDVCDRILLSFRDEWNDIQDDGSQFLGTEDYFAKDVDMLGFNSLYQKINLAHTPKGKQRLAALFSLSQEDIEHRESRQEAIGELVNNIDFVVDFSAGTKLLDNKKAKSDGIDAFAKYCGDEEQGILPVWARSISLILPAIFWVFLLLWIGGITHYGYALVMFFINLSVTILTRHITDRVIQPLYVMCMVFEGYMDALETLKDNKFKAEQLKELQDELCGKDGTYQAFKGLKGISQAYNISFNPVLHQVLSALFFWDYQLAAGVSGWKKKYGRNISGCFENIAEIEALISLALVGIIHECCWGELQYEDNVGMNVKDAYHPLINQQKVVANTAQLNNGITIITGSNMSGKTTFLRTLAMNLALLYMGAPVCAKEFRSSYMKIFTSMRVADDVAHGISTFYAEILRIKTMSEYKNVNKPMLCLIDEIFKGTNSADRIVGAKGVITGLADSNTMVVVSTHDFELCELKSSNGDNVTNHHFEEYYEDGQLKFDYKIKGGRCTTTNAKAILKMAGFDI